MRILAMASSTAASEPGQGDIHQSAIDAVFDKRVSCTLTFGPRFFASMIRCACGLKEWPVSAHPERVAGPRARRAYVGGVVVAVDTPGVEDALQVDQLVAGPAEVIH